jgi:type II secretory pathway pseudopilin PulG
MTEMLVAVIVLGVAMAVLSSALLGARRLVRDAAWAEDALRAAESQIEALRALPPAGRPTGSDLPALAAGETLERLPAGLCTLAVEPFRDADGAAPLLRVRVRVEWAGACGPRELTLCTVLNATR